MTLRDFFDTFTSSPAVGIFPVVLPTATALRGTIEIRIENPHGVPAHYAVAWLRRSGRPVTRVDETERRVGIPTRRTIQILLDESSIDADHLITIRAAGRTSKLVLYREWLERGTSPGVSVAIAATGAVRFGVSRPLSRPEVA
ncbi:MAG: hypothetical protein WCJ31_16880 [Planctomycetia bacterium]